MGADASLEDGPELSLEFEVIYHYLENTTLNLFKLRIPGSSAGSTESSDNNQENRINSI